MLVSETITIDHDTPITQAYQRMKERRKETNAPPVKWRYFQATEDFQEHDEPQQYFIVCTHDELRKIKTGNLIAAGIQSAKILFWQRRRQRGPGLDGWYVQSTSKDGSTTWFLLGADVNEVVAYYDSL